MTAPNIVVIGAGSRSFGLYMLRSLLAEPRLEGARVTLVDLDPGRLAEAVRLGEMIREAGGVPTTIGGTTDRQEALPGCDYVIVSLAVKRSLRWQEDFYRPLRWGFSHCLGENAGPGGLFHTLRNIPRMVAIARDMEELCPDASLLTFTNPENRICQALKMTSSIRALGFCHGVLGTIPRVAGWLGLRADEIGYSACGVNHFVWLTRLCHARSGEDLYPAFRAFAATRPAPPGWELCLEMLRVFDYFPTTGDSHVGEFVSYGREYYTAGADANTLSDDTLNQSFRDYLEGRRDTAEIASAPGGEVLVESLIALHRKEQRRLGTVILPNNGAAENLPDDGVIEGVALFEDGGVRLEPVGHVPEPVAAMLRLEMDIQRLAAQAALAGSRKAALQALLLDPNVDSLERAEGLLDDMLARQDDLPGLR
jgi:alpha-galactosidase